MTNFYVYILRRPDKIDPFDKRKACPFYVGKGREDRIRNHRWEATSFLRNPGRKGYKVAVIHKLWMQDLDFIEEIYVKELTEEQAFEIERFLIEKYGRSDRCTGTLVNLTDGGEGVSGRIVSKETRIKIGKANSSKVYTEEQRRKNSESHIGNIPSEETRKKMSEAHKGRFFSEESCKKISESHIGKTHSKEARKKISEARKGKPISEEHRKKIIEALKGRQCSEETRKKIGNANRGKIHSEEYCKKLSDRVRKAWAEGHFAMRKKRGKNKAKGVIEENYNA